MRKQPFGLFVLVGLAACHIPGPLPFSTGPALPSCGDLVLDPDESCDDGSRNNNQWGDCTEQCTIPYCGDGLVHEPTEQCDPGTGEGLCFPDCTLPATCGDGILHELEGCDLGSENVDVEYGLPGGCSSRCQPIPYCGDGNLDEGYEHCDDANTSNNDACTNSCEVNTCGDGFVYAGYEDCDDANSLNTDACLNDCSFASCGDGFVHEGEEECDGQTDCGPNCITDRYVFVTKEVFRGELDEGLGETGIERADWLCKIHAEAGKLHLGKDFRAWISDDASSPATRFYRSPGRYIMADGTVFAQSWDALTQLEIDNALFMTEYGEEPSSGGSWTNTLPDGTIASDDHCQGWSTSHFEVRGRVGLLTFVDNQWTDAEGGPQPLPCDIDNHLYCFEQ
ncbi:MAG: DUF4215 domain-containing protein [Nannocystaceae bacterium]